MPPPRPTGGNFGGGFNAQLPPGFVPGGGANIPPGVLGAPTAPGGGFTGIQGGGSGFGYPEFAPPSQQITSPATGAGGSAQYGPSNQALQTAQGVNNFSLSQQFPTNPYWNWSGGQSGGQSAGWNLGASQGTSSGQAQNTGSSFGQSQSTPEMIAGMQNIYGQLLGLNQQNYGNVLNAYNAGQGNLANTLPGVYGGYGGLNSNVQNILGMGQVLGENGNWGVATPAAQAIERAYAQQRGGIDQDMANRGLGNTSVGSNLQNQATLQAGQAYGNLGAQLAQTAAGYTSQLGLAGQQAQLQGLGMQTGLTQGALGALGNQFSNTAGPLWGQGSTSTQGSQQQGTSGQQSAQNAWNAGQNQAWNGAWNLGMGAGGGGGGGFSLVTNNAGGQAPPPPQTTPPSSQYPPTQYPPTPPSQYIPPGTGVGGGNNFGGGGAGGGGAFPPFMGGPGFGFQPPAYPGGGGGGGGGSPGLGGFPTTPGGGGSMLPENTGGGGGGGYTATPGAPPSPSGPYDPMQPQFPSTPGAPNQPYGYGPGGIGVYGQPQPWDPTQNPLGGSGPYAPWQPPPGPGQPGAFGGPQPWEIPGLLGPEGTPWYGSPQNPGIPEPPLPPSSLPNFGPGSVNWPGPQDPGQQFGPDNPWYGVGVGGGGYGWMGIGAPGQGGAPNYFGPGGQIGGGTGYGGGYFGEPVQAQPFMPGGGQQQIQPVPQQVWGGNLGR